MLKRIGKILLRFALAIFLLVYVVVALVNYSVVQSVIGSVASDHFTNEWGGKVRIGSLGCNPMNHLVLRDVELIAPGDDTVCVARKIALRFDGLPFDSHGLTFSKVQLSDVLYHLSIDSVGLNLDFIINYYYSDEPSEESDEETEFKVLVDDLVMDNVCYRQDLEDDRTELERLSIPGVDVLHMEYREIDAHIRNVRVDLDRVTCRIDKFSTTERSGLQVKDLRGNVYATRSGISVTNLNLQTADSKLSGDVLLDYRDWESMDEFLDSVYFTIHFDEGSYGGMQDAAYWASPLWGMDHQVYIEGDFAGPISDFRADNVKLAFGDETTIDLDGYIYGLPNIDTTIIGADIHHLHTTYADLAAVRHPDGIKMKAEKIMKALNNIDLEASFTGTIYDFYATIGLQSDLGNIKGDVLLAMNPQKKEYRYTGQLSSSGFKIGRVAPNEWLSRGGFDLTFEGNGFDPKTMNASAEGQLHHLVVKGQRLIGEVALEADATNGLVTLDASIDDLLASLIVHGEGDWREDYPVYRATVDAQHLDLKRFGLWNNENDSVAQVAFHATARHSEPDDANSYSRIGLTDVHLLTIGKKKVSSDDVVNRNIHLKNLSLSSRMQNHWMNTTLRSDIADANLRGYYQYSSLPVLLSHIIDDYLPNSIIESPWSKPSDIATSSLADSRFEFNLEWKDTSALIRSFVPDLYISPGSSIQANYNFADGFKPIVRSDSIGWGNLRFYDVGINGEAISDHYRLQMKSDRLMLGQLQMMDFGTVRMETSRENMSCRLTWQNSSQTIGGGDINLRMVADSNLLRLVVDPSHLALGNRDWQVVSTGDNYLMLPGREATSPSDTANETILHIDRLGISSGEQQLVFYGSLHSTPETDEAPTTEKNNHNDSIILQLTNVGLDIINPFVANSGIQLDGHANGIVTRSDVTTGNLQVSDLAFNGETLGDINIYSSLDDSLQRLNVKAYSNQTKKKTDKFHLYLDGYTLLDEDNPELHFDADISHLNLNVVEPFVSSFSSNVDGEASANIELRGTTDAPVVTGMLSVGDGLMKVDFLNVAYSFSDTIHIDSTSVHFDDFKLRDPEGGVAHVDGAIKHKHFNDMRVDLTLRSMRLLCMNTSAKDNSAFYGRIVATADGIVKGPFNNLDIVLNARTLEGTSLNVPINDKKQMEKADYIQFLSDDYEMLASEDDESQALLLYAENQTNEAEGNQVNGQASDAESSEKSQYSLTINVDATPDMQFRLPMEFSSIDVDVRTKGTGNLQLTLGTGRGFGVVGDYELSGGTLLLDLLGVVSKEFTIDNGSSISFPGNIERAMFDIRAVLSQRVNLSSLTGSLSSTDSQKPIQVENVIALSGTLQSPNVGFDIRLPSADQSVQEEVFSYIDRNNERDMLTQTVSLLVTKRFYNASANADLSGGESTTGSQAYGIVMGTLGSVISDMVQVVNVNFDYQSGNGVTTDQYAVDISKEWNKFYFESTFGFGGESREMATSGQGTNNMTGDMLVGYKINPRLHLFVFNRSNTNDYTRSDLPYKQGLGVKYTRDFDRLGDLFRKKKKK